MIYLGVNIGHGASAALMINDEVILTFQEERFTNIKNFVGYPKKSIQACLDFVKNKKLTIDKCGIATVNHFLFNLKYPLENYYSIENWMDYYLQFFSKQKKINYTVQTIKKLQKIKKIDGYLDYSKIKKKNYFNFSLTRKFYINFINKQSEGLIKSISHIDHHTCHAYYAAYAPDINETKSAILTIDSEGDGLNQTLWIFDKNKKKLKNLIRNSECDLARIYRFVTLILKMKPNEHEFKVMGLAPYSKIEYSKKVYDEVFKDILDVKNCKVIHKNRSKDLFKYLYNKTREHRFDSIAGGVQMLVEKISSKLVNQIAKKYKLNTFSISGGVSMNIKMNKILSELKNVKKLYVPPTGTDESLAVGACYYLNKLGNSKPFKNIYLGQELVDEDLTKKKLETYLKNNNKYLIKKNIDHKHVAKLLSQGNIVAVARGREEFGARALGNRSILANPYIDGVVQKINEQIKNRDFWMPFALTILKEHHKKYLINNKSIDCDFMTIGFDTKIDKYNDIKNGTHPYDKSVRPQILSKKYNENYHSLINEFYKITKVPALLNTSLNLHGFPISSKIKDVISTFENSGLEYLYLEDNFLVKKK
jgi:carbamoyltransferase